MRTAASSSPVSRAAAGVPGVAEKHESGDPARPATTLIVNADDLGETAEITRGILDCIDAGVVTSTTILPNMPATELALREAAARGRRASFGVHLNLCEGPTLTRAPSLGPGGAFRRKRAQALRAFTGRLDPREVEGELRAQIARVRDAGVQISHLDSHKHLHQLPGVAEIVIGLAGEFGIERVRCTLEAGAPLDGVRPLSALSALVRRRLARRFRRKLAATALRYPAGTFDLARVLSLPEGARRVDLLRAAGSPAEMVCHPGTRAADLEKPGSCPRFDEYRFLRSEGFRSLLGRAGARLATFWEV
ncbi:MAG TPA: ChbG/HpnK family deacetylase [Gemmatimonadota bacterium]